MNKNNSEVNKNALKVTEAAKIKEKVIDYILKKIIK